MAVPALLRFRSAMSAEQVWGLGNCTASRVVEDRPMDRFISAQLREQMGELMVLDRCNLADIGIGCTLLQAGRELHHIAFGLERCDVQFLDIFGIGFRFDRLAASRRDQLGERIAVPLMVAKEHQRDIKHTLAQQPAAAGDPVSAMPSCSSASPPASR